MAIEEIIAELGAEINRLEQAKKLISDGRTAQPGPLILKRTAGPKEAHS